MAGPAGHRVRSCIGVLIVATALTIIARAQHSSPPHHHLSCHLARVDAGVESETRLVACSSLLSCARDRSAFEDSANLVAAISESDRSDTSHWDRGTSERRQAATLPACGPDIVASMRGRGSVGGGIWSTLAFCCAFHLSSASARQYMESTFICHGAIVGESSA